MSKRGRQESVPTKQVVPCRQEWPLVSLPVPFLAMRRKEMTTKFTCLLLCDMFDIGLFN